MKKVIYLLLITLFISSCATRKSGYDNLEVTQFNQTISQRIDIESAGQLAELFYNWSPHKPLPNFEITVKSNGNMHEVTLVHIDVPDNGDAKDIRLELKAERKMQVWTVLEARKSWKCRSGRGKDVWSNAECK